MTWQTLLAIDFDKWAAATYRANFPGVRVESGPVADYIDSLPDADVIVGGPPCQPFSEGGKNAGEHDKRNGIADFIRSVRRVRPRMFLMENVRGLLRPKHADYFDGILKLMVGDGYAVQYKLLDAVAYGVPQFRKRVWVWGIRRDLFLDGIRHVWPSPTHVWPAGISIFESKLPPGVTIGQALGLDGAIRKPRSTKIIRRDHPTNEPCPTVEARASIGGGSCLRFIPARVIGAGSNPHFSGDSRTERDITDEPSPTIACGDHFGNVLPRLELTGPQTDDRPCYTITAGSHQGGPEPIPNRIAKGFSRRLTPLECARLQSMPNDFSWPENITKGAMYRIVGNGQACGITVRLAESFRSTDPNSRTMIDLFCGGGLGAVGWHGRYWAYEPEEVMP